MISNSQELLDYVYERQKLKFGETTKEELYRKLRCEVLELIEANRQYYMKGSFENAESIKYEEADVIIVANRLYQEFQDEIAWALLSKYYNYESASWVKKKWDIVEKRKYKKDKFNNWQHMENEDEL